MSKFKFTQVHQKLDTATKQAAIEMMRASKKYFGEGFDNEGMLGEEKWAMVARRIDGHRFNKAQRVWAYNFPTGKYVKIDQGADWRTRKILKGTTGRLRYKTVRANSSITNKGRTAVMRNPVPYARYHNEGTAYMPQRMFMSHTPELTKIHLQILLDKTGNVWQVV